MEESNKKLAQKIYDLDAVKQDLPWSDDMLWDAINEKRNGNYRIYQVAAVIVLILSFSIGISWYVSTDSDSQLSWSQEQQTDLEDNDYDISSIETEALEIIQHNCIQRQLICENPAFKTLNVELDNLEMEIESLNLMINQYGNDPTFIKSRIQLENVKAEIINQLMQMVLS